MLTSVILYGHNNYKNHHNMGLKYYIKENCVKTMKKGIYGLLSVLTLFAGLFIYLFFRDLSNMVIFTWIPKPDFLETVLIRLKPSILSNFLRYHLPDMLWFLSGIFFFRFIWFYKIKIQKVYVLCFYGFGLVLETSQLSDNIPGTFDWLDLFFMGIVAFVESLLYKKIILRRLG